MHSLFLSSINSLIINIENLILLQQNQLKTEIEGSKRILEGGSLLYESNRSVAISIWKVLDTRPPLRSPPLPSSLCSSNPALINIPHQNVAALSHPKLDEGIIGVEFPSLLETIAAHGRGLFLFFFSFFFFLFSFSFSLFFFLLVFSSSLLLLFLNYVQ